MLMTVTLRLVPSENQKELLKATLRMFNKACNYISVIAHENKVYTRFKLHKLCYADVRKKFSLSAQMAVLALGKVVGKYKRDKSRLHTFEKTDPLLYDERILSFRGLEVASIMTTEGRMKVPIVLSHYAQGLLCGNRLPGHADLFLKDDTFYLLLVIDAPADSFAENDYGARASHALVR